jgi:protein-tyrosine phosphatase
VDGTTKNCFIFTFYLFLQNQIKLLNPEKLILAQLLLLRLKMSAINVLGNRVFLGNEDNARNLDLLQSYAITHVISLTHSVYHPEKIVYYPINIDDSPVANIYQYFEPCVEFINDALAARDSHSGMNVLVHCAAGISRSASIVIAYIMSAQRVDYETALGMVRADRHYVCPNEGFVLQLRQWQMALGIPFRHPASSVEPIWRSPNGRVAFYDIIALFQPKDQQPDPAATQIITRFFMQDQIGGYRVELMNGAPQSVYTGFTFSHVLKPVDNAQKEQIPSQVIICPNRVLMTFLVAKCLRILGLEFVEIISELERRQMDLNPYIRQQLEQLITGGSEDLAQERLGLLETYSRYINYHTPNDSDDRLWGIYDLLLKFETWAIPDIINKRDGLIFLVANKLGLDTPEDEFQFHDADDTKQVPEPSTAPDSLATITETTSDEEPDE